MELLGVLGAQFQQGQFIPFLRNAEVNAGDFHVREERYDNLFGEFPELVLDFADEGAEHRRGFLFNLAAQAQVQALDDGAAADAEEVAVGIGPIQNQGEDIGVHIGRLGDDTLGIVAFQEGEAVLVALRFLKGQAFGGIGHQRLVMPDHFPAATA